MNGPINTQRLRGAKPIDYFSQVLRTGGADDANFNLSQLRQGEFIALVPQNTSQERLTRFSEGGLLMAEPLRASSSTTVQEVPTPIPAISTIVWKQISLFKDPVLWIHEPMLLEEEINARRIHYKNIQGKLYLEYAGLHAAEHLAGLIRYSMLSWHFLAFITTRVNEVSSVSDLVRNSQMIVVGAYDGESVLLWQRR